MPAFKSLMRATMNTAPHSRRRQASRFVPTSHAFPIMLLWASLALSLVLGSRFSEQIPLSGSSAGQDRMESSFERILGSEYDYIVVGAGPAGIVAADRLSESSPYVKVLLIDRGNASTWSSGGRDQTWWMQGHNITRFDVPGLFQTDRRANYFCDDTEPLAGCVVGGGTAVNSGLYFYPPDEDWDANYPKGSGWTSEDMVMATKKARQRLPSTDRPSADGNLYLKESYDIFGAYLSKGGWLEVSSNGQVNSKDKSYGRSAFMTIAGERAGPLGPYLNSALKRKNFDFLLNTKVRRVARHGEKVYGVEVETSSGTPQRKSIIHVKGWHKAFTGNVEDRPSKRLGKVLLTAGALGTPKILFRSGIGPSDVLKTVRDYTGPNDMIDEKEWVLLPVGYNLVDHSATHLIFRHPDIVQYNHSGAWDEPNPEDAMIYLNNRSGPLAATNARLSFWMQVKGEDGVRRVIQGNSRAGSALGYTHPNNLLVTLYLGRGMTSRGRLALSPTSDLKVVIPSTPYLTTAEDLSAVVTAAQSLLSNFSTYAANSGLELILPNSSSSDAIEKYIREYPLGADLSRGGNHWMGSCMMGPGGVVGWDGKVKGMENLFVMDASVFRGMVSSNPVAAIVVGAERGVERILQRK